MNVAVLSDLGVDTSAVVKQKQTRLVDLAVRAFSALPSQSKVEEPNVTRHRKKTITERGGSGPIPNAGCVGNIEEAGGYNGGRDEERGVPNGHAGEGRF